jgi:hypothetical protein
MANIRRTIKLSNELQKQWIAKYDKPIPDELKHTNFETELKQEFVEIGQDLRTIDPATESIIFDTFDNDHTWEDLKLLPKSVKELYLGHDGVILIEKPETVEQILLALPNLTKLGFCGYYTTAEIKNGLDWSNFSDNRTYLEEFEFIAKKLNRTIQFYTIY